MRDYYHVRRSESEDSRCLDGIPFSLHNTTFHIEHEFDFRGRKVLVVNQYTLVRDRDGRVHEVNHVIVPGTPVEYLYRQLQDGTHVSKVVEVPGRLRRGLTSLLREKGLNKGPIIFWKA